jgi:hypothetical protein
LPAPLVCPDAGTGNMDFDLVVFFFANDGSPVMISLTGCPERSSSGGRLFSMRRRAGRHDTAIIPPAIYQGPILRAGIPVAGRVGCLKA